MLHSVWRAILDNFRPMTVWGGDMLIYYIVSQAFGEPWSAPGSLVQLLGLFVLLYGTAIYNAPNPGSLLLQGEPHNCFLDFSSEYPKSSAELEDEDFIPVVSLASLPSPFLHSPFLSPRGGRQSGVPLPVASSSQGRLLTLTSTGARSGYGGLRSGDDEPLHPALRKTASLDL